MRESACLAILGLVGIGLATAPAAPSTSSTGGVKMVALTKAVFVKVDNLAERRVEKKISKTAVKLERVLDTSNQEKVEEKVDHNSGMTVEMRRHDQAIVNRTVTRFAR